MALCFLGNHTASWFGIQRSFDLGMNWEWILPYIAASALEYLNDGSVLAGADESALPLMQVFTKPQIMAIFGLIQIHLMIGIIILSILYLIQMMIFMLV